MVSARSSSGFTLSWQGTGLLQSARNLSGPWQDIPASSPFVVVFDSYASFFRIKQTNSPPAP